MESRSHRYAQREAQKRNALSGDAAPVKKKKLKVPDIPDKPVVSTESLPAVKRKKLKSEYFAKKIDDIPIVSIESHADTVPSKSTTKTKITAGIGTESDLKNGRNKLEVETSTSTNTKSESKENKKRGEKERNSTKIKPKDESKTLGEKLKKCTESKSKTESAKNSVTLRTRSEIKVKPLKQNLTRMRGTKEEKTTEIKKTKSSGGVKKEAEWTKMTDDVKSEGHVVRIGEKCHDCLMFVGGHVSAQGGVHKSVVEAVEIGASSFALFLRNQRQWNAKPLDEEVATKFRAACVEHGFAPNMILPHASYLMNLGSPDPEKLQKSRDLLVDELRRCESLGLTLYNFHPGSTCGETSVEKCLQTIAESINIGHSQTKYVITVLENMSCQGNTIGGTFEELRGIIDQVKDKSRVGVCLDTCHAFAAGFDLSTEEGFKHFVKSFKEIVGAQYLKAMHINDSVGPRGCHRDRHENIGKGKIGLKGFSFVMNEPMFRHIPMILETPGGVGYDKEIQLLHSLCKNQDLAADDRQWKS